MLFEVMFLMVCKLDIIVVCIKDSEEYVFGELKVIMIMGFGMMWLVLCLVKFYDCYFDLKIDLMLEEWVLDFFMCEVDVVICMKEFS